MKGRFCAIFKEDNICKTYSQIELMKRELKLFYNGDKGKWATSMLKFIKRNLPLSYYLKKVIYYRDIYSLG